MANRARVTVLYAGNPSARAAGSATWRRRRRCCATTIWVSRFSWSATGLGRKELEATTRRLGLGNLALLPPQAWQDVPEVLACGDVAVLVQPPGTEQISGAEQGLHGARRGQRRSLAATWNDSDPLSALAA